MDRGPLLALTLVLSMVLAGCGGTGGVETREPFSVPSTETQSPGDDSVLLDLSFSPDPAEDLLGDPAVFLSSQARRLNGTSYTIDYELSVRYDNGTTRNRVAITGEFGRNRSVYRSNVTRWGRTGNRTRLLYANGTVLATATGPAGLTHERANGSIASAADGTPVDPLDAGTFRGLRPEFVYNGFASTNVTEVRELDRVPSGIDDQLFHVRATAVDRPEALVGSVLPATEVERVENVTVEAIVASDGFVYEYAVQYTVVRPDGTRIHVTRRLVYRAVGQTVVTPPGWASDTLENELAHPSRGRLDGHSAEVGDCDGSPPMLWPWESSPVHRPVGIAS